MSKDDSIGAVLKAAQARLLAEAQARIELETAADMEVLHKLAAKYNLRVISADDALPEIPDIPSIPKLPTTSSVAMPKAAFRAFSNRVPDGYQQGVTVTASVETLGELIRLYRTHDSSPYRTLRFKVRLGTDNMLDRMLEHGDLRLVDLNADGIRKLYDVWVGDGKVATGHAFVTKLRGLFGFGTTVLDDPGCQRLSTIMNKMRFTMPPTRDERLTEAHTKAIIAKAHEMVRPSIALAQAIQFSFGLGQKDTIGEYVPVTEAGQSDIIVDGMKWLHGIRWDNVNDALVLRHVTSFGGKFLELDLKRAPMVLAELEKQFTGVIPKRGAIIISEWNKKPWSANEFRRWWRKIADAAGVPKSIKNMDSGRASDREQFAVKGGSFEGLDLEGETEARLH
ncbi:hypothetical protein IVB27_00205 [Bradyrhizobium sp. 197]|jgi:hypothetical protein|uniref:hypothetical protein n=1 Tax=Bradyrhizobium sp. 197 TaxID=2782663 RepID=UPI001FF7ABFD|nr:hypothetical protein [Bradyrhizobium sp. 197]MCK1473254.1 hypothetical protein [Bradyrhizobium sp. 197]